ncbi:MAG: DUF2474 domain-containing protein [Sphingomonadaceae bacterium]
MKAIIDMHAPPGPRPGSNGAPKSWWRRIGWLVLIWSASVATLAIVAGILRLLMNAAGLTS